jgi:PHD/YefM family antitoxin component YafN of YafNO toxin-antitoxin module
MPQVPFEGVPHFGAAVIAAEILITRHGKPAGVLIGFESEDDWLDYRLEHHPEFLRRVAAAREALKSGRGVRLEDLPS